MKRECQYVDFLFFVFFFIFIYFCRILCYIYRKFFACVESSYDSIFISPSGFFPIQPKKNPDTLSNPLPGKNSGKFSPFCFGETSRKVGNFTNESVIFQLQFLQALLQNSENWLNDLLLPPEYNRKMHKRIWQLKLCPKLELFSLKINSFMHYLFVFNWRSSNPWEIWSQSVCGFFPRVIVTYLLNFSTDESLQRTLIYAENRRKQSSTCFPKSTCFLAGTTQLPHKRILKSVGKHVGKELLFFMPHDVAQKAFWQPWISKEKSFLPQYVHTT